MATLQKFKLFATQCSFDAGSPAHSSPTASPVVVPLRRRKSLRALLTRSSSSSGGDDDLRRPLQRGSPNGRSIFARRTPPPTPPGRNDELLRRPLKDFFMDSPPLEEEAGPRERLKGGESGVLALAAGRLGLGLGPGSPRPVSAGFRHRLVKRIWRPKLASIPE